MTTPPTTLHDRLKAELDRRLAVAKAAGGWTWMCEQPHDFHALLWSRKPDEPKIAVTHGTLNLSAPLRDFVALHDPADAIRRYLGELEVLERHAPMSGGSCEQCWHGTPDDSTWPCPEIRSLASRLGVSLDG